MEYLISAKDQRKRTTQGLTETQKGFLEEVKKEINHNASIGQSNYYIAYPTKLFTETIQNSRKFFENLGYVVEIGDIKDPNALFDVSARAILISWE